MGLVERYAKVLKLPTNEAKRRKIVRALKRSTYDYSSLGPHVPAPITVAFASINHFGTFSVEHNRLRILDGLQGSMLASTLHHELFHAIDCYALTYDDRLAIWSAFHPNDPPTGTYNVWSGYARDPKCPKHEGLGLGWIGYGPTDDPDQWEKSMGEISAEAFTMAYEVTPVWNDDDAYHVVTEEVLETLRNVAP